MTTYKFVSPDHDVSLRVGPDTTYSRWENSGLPTSVLMTTGYIVRGTVVYGDAIITLNGDVYSAGVKVGLDGDKWMHVTKLGDVEITGKDVYTAIWHMGKTSASGSTFTEFPDPTPDPTPTTPTFPESFTLVDPQGNKAEYAFVRIME